MPNNTVYVIKYFKTMLYNLFTKYTIYDIMSMLYNMNITEYMYELIAIIKTMYVYYVKYVHDTSMIITKCVHHHDMFTKKITYTIMPRCTIPLSGTTTERPKRRELSFEHDRSINRIVNKSSDPLRAMSKQTKQGEAGNKKNENMNTMFTMYKFSDDDHKFHVADYAILHNAVERAKEVHNLHNEKIKLRAMLQMMASRYFSSDSFKNETPEVQHAMQLQFLHATTYFHHSVKSSLNNSSSH